MSTNRTNLGHFASLLGYGLRFEDHWEALCSLNGGAWEPSGRFSAGLDPLCRRSQHANNSPHRPAHLLQGDRTMAALPRQPHGLYQRTSQHQLIVDDGHDLRPALKLLWGPQARLPPQQVLLVKAIAVLP